MILSSKGKGRRSAALAELFRLQYEEAALRSRLLLRYLTLGHECSLALACKERLLVIFGKQEIKP